MMEEAIDVAKEMDIPILFPSRTRKMMDRILIPMKRLSWPKSTLGESHNETSFDATRAYLNELSKSQLLTQTKKSFTVNALCVAIWMRARS